METLIKLLIEWWDTLKLFELVAPDDCAVRVTYLGRATPKNIGNGFCWKFPVIQSISTINTMPQIVDLRAQSVVSKTGQSVGASGAIEYEVIDPVKAIYGVYDFNRNMQAGALGIIAHFINNADDWTRADDVAKDMKANMQKLAKQCGLRIRKVMITDLDKSRAIRLMGIEPHKAGDK